MLENLETAGAGISSDEAAGCSQLPEPAPSAALRDSAAPQQPDKTNITLTVGLEQSSEGQFRKGGILTESEINMAHLSVYLP